MNAARDVGYRLGIRALVASRARRAGNGLVLSSDRPYSSIGDIHPHRVVAIHPAVRRLDPMLTNSLRWIVAVLLLATACTTPAANRTDASTCLPACRPGFVCVVGVCVSACNPPCPSGMRCTPDLQCVSPDGGTTSFDVPLVPDVVASDHSVDSSFDAALPDVVDDTGLVDVTPPPTCFPGEHVCGSTCSDLQSDPLNCARCGAVCHPGVNAIAQCVGAMCGIQCRPLFMPSPPGACVPSTTPEGTWRNAPSTSIGFDNMKAIWTGREVIVVIFPPVGSMFITGIAYNPTTDRWRWLPTSGSSRPREHFSVAWSGTEILVWGGISAADSSYLGDGYVYIPAIDTWAPLPSVAAPSARRDALAAWAGDRFVVWGGSDATGPLNTGAEFFPATNSWSAIPPNPMSTPSPRVGASGAWTGHELLIWGGCRVFGASPADCYADGVRYTPSTRGWLPMDTTGAPSPRTMYAEAWTGAEWLVWGGGVFDLGTMTWSVLNDGARYDPSLDRWTAMPTAPIAGRYGASGVWTGVEFVVWGGSNGSGTLFGDGSRFDPAAGTWNVLSNTMAPVGRMAGSGGVDRKGKDRRWGRSVRFADGDSGGMAAVTILAIRPDGVSRAHVRSHRALDRDQRAVADRSLSPLASLAFVRRHEPLGGEYHALRFAMRWGRCARDAREARCCVPVVA